MASHLVGGDVDSALPPFVWGKFSPVFSNLFLESRSLVLCTRVYNSIMQVVRSPLQLFSEFAVKIIQQHAPAYIHIEDSFMIATPTYE